MGLSRARARLAGVMLAVVAWGASGAAVAADEVLTFRSEFYEVTTTLDRAMAIDVAQHMDAVHREYAARFAHFRGRQLQHHPLYVFATQAQYHAFLGEHELDGRGSAGMFFVGPRGSGLATFLQGQGLTRMLRTLRHEGFHQFAHSKIGRDLPQWANEGLAEYFAEGIVPERGGMQAGQVSPASLHHLQTVIEEEAYVPFRELLHLSNAEWNERVRGGDSRLLYDQSWSIVHFLVHADRRYQQAFEDYLVMVGRGMGSRQAFDRAFQSPEYAVFEQVWRDYVRELEPTPEVTAALRLTFIGEGMRLLQDRGREVGSLEQVRDDLRAAGFAMQIGLGHGTTFEMQAANDEHFEAPEPAPWEQRRVLGRPQRGAGEERGSELEFVPAAEESDLPPSLVVRGLSHVVRLEWREGPDGEAVSHIVYE